MLPLGKSLDIGIAGNWQFEWAAVQVPTEEDKATYRLNRRWIQPFDIPVLIDSQVIAIKCSLANAPPTWSSAGTLLRIVDFPKDTLTIEDDFPGIPTATLDKRYVRLNADFEILIFNQSSDTLKLSFIPKPWLTSLGIVVYSYSGLIGDDVTDKIDAIRVKLEAIDAKIG
ncbi:hypothetical protein [Nodosilinea sp. FACHB-13]|uniref:hypothetical protein n=1 Tax=Cyanophyceae TaxID=3028117 RepID=UPI0016888625|nr:hypothetical protein [Nodosilinea sp. FACHB-13]MBD2107426.1 hypothetical protein [Nodosilinea sp. FACHB-13]